MVTPRSARVFRLSCTAGCRSIVGFIAGAIRTGQGAARSAVVRKSSATPQAYFPRKLAVAGATMTKSAAGCRSSRPWVTQRWSRGSGGGSASVRTGWSDKV